MLTELKQAGHVGSFLYCCFWLHDVTCSSCCLGSFTIVDHNLKLWAKWTLSWPVVFPQGVFIPVTLESTAGFPLHAPGCQCSFHKTRVPETRGQFSVSVHLYISGCLSILSSTNTQRKPRSTVLNSLYPDITCSVRKACWLWNIQPRQRWPREVWPSW